MILTICIRFLIIFCLLNTKVFSKISKPKNPHFFASYPKTAEDLEKRDSLLDINELTKLNELTMDEIIEIAQKEIIAERIAQNENKKVIKEIDFWKKFIFIDFSFLYSKQKNEPLIKNKIYVNTLIHDYNKVSTYDKTKSDNISAWLCKSNKNNIINDAINSHIKLKEYTIKEMQLDTIKKQVAYNISCMLGVTTCLAIFWYTYKK